VGFGPPSLSGGATRTFAIQSPSSPCPVPSTAQAYSFNMTVVPPGATFPGNVTPSGALSYLTIWPTGVPQPVVSTLNSFLGTVVANAAIVPAGTGGSVDVFVSHGANLSLRHLETMNSAESAPHNHQLLRHVRRSDAGRLGKRSIDLQNDNDGLRSENKTLEDRMKTQEDRIRRLEEVLNLTH